ncbi:MAG TPA: hypothetical protein VJS38_13710 [Phenylobacterium sp.]|uniref:hypothetical protein n=1 Tax=Phenylobacterium sp. TaxID=1871053 RepID=UPI002B465360|nr:hypothetical protein [Phenylobacterium sp.]HKR89222.1 hypothetical protein [Phenylobacterium sp.]
MARVRDPELRPFDDSGYEILDDELLTKGELVIWSIDPLRPRIGDLYTIVSGGCVHEVEVAVVTEVKGGWSARCRLYGLLS